MTAAARRRPLLRPRLAAELLREGRAVEITLGGSSMRPLLAPGTLITVEPAGAADVEAGDVVVVDLDGKLLCHRLVRKSAAAIVTRGDACSGDDEPLPPDAIVGRVPIAPSPHALYCAIRALLRR